MKHTYWVFAACLSLLLLGGLAYDVSAQQTAPPSAAPSAPPTEPTKPSVTPPTSTDPASPAPSGQMRQETPQPPSTNTIERSTEKTTVVDRDGGRIFGMQASVALIIGAVLLVVIVLGLVAMSRGGRDTEVHHEHHHRV